MVYSISLEFSMNILLGEFRSFFRTYPDAVLLIAMLLKLIDDGKITAIDNNKDTYEIGWLIIDKADVEHKIDFIQSPALPILDNLLQDKENEGSFDFAFVDADKENYLNCYKRLVKLVKIGGLLAYNNILWGGFVALPLEKIPEHKRKLTTTRELQQGNSR